MTAYQYDVANRLTSVNGQTYTWDDNGNLLNDGISKYRYDQASHLISATLGSTTSLFTYTGDGARLRQIIAGVPTTYTQDLAAPLPVVLQSKTGANATRYVYALSTRPLAQNGGAWEYLLADALGSVRQIVDANGNITLAESYEPYGSLLSSNGTASSVFAYAGEETDTSGLVYLRARYMSPKLGIFLARDPWSGEAMRPRSMNGWNYGLGNPVMYTDPDGRDPWWCQWAPDPEKCKQDNTPPPPTEDPLVATVGLRIIHYKCERIFLPLLPPPPEDVDWSIFSLGTYMVDGRLYTHNHYDDRTGYSPGKPDANTTIEVFDSSGQSLGTTDLLPGGFPGPGKDSYSTYYWPSGVRQPAGAASYSKVTDHDGPNLSVAVVKWRTHQLYNGFTFPMAEYGIESKNTIATMEYSGAIAGDHQSQIGFSEGDSGGGLWYQGRVIGNHTRGSDPNVGRFSLLTP